jgi:hypothetical protein
MLSEETSKNLMHSPLPGGPNVGEGILRPGGEVHPPLILRRGRGLSVLPVLLNVHRAHEHARV